MQKILGYDSVWVQDHISHGRDRLIHWSAGTVEQLTESAPMDKIGNFYEALTTLAYVAGLTNRVRLGTSVMCLPTRNPIILAKQAATVHRMSGERFLMGIGVGTDKWDFDVLGVPFDQRGAITDEYIQVMKKVWEGERVSFEGKFIKFQNAEFFPRARNLPIWIGGGAGTQLGQEGAVKLIKPVIRRTAMYADGWIPGGSPEVFKKGIPEIERQARQYGRDASKFEFALETDFCISKDSQEALGISAASLASRWKTIQKGQERSFVGSPNEIMRKIEEYSEAGVNVFEFKFICPDLETMLKMMELFSNEVMPSFV